MSTATVATPPSALPNRASCFWRFSVGERNTPSLTDPIPSPSVPRRRPFSAIGVVTRRKSADAIRNRNSWRNSWRNILPKPFNGGQNGGGLRGGKNKIRKKSTDSLRDVSEQSVEQRKKMENLLRLWHSEMVDSSDESSEEDDGSPLGRRGRSCSPRVIDDDTSSSEDDEILPVGGGDELILEAPVSLYVSEGPSRMSFSDQGGCRESGEACEDEGRVELRNFDAEVLTARRTMINQTDRNNVISALQICRLDRSAGDSVDRGCYWCCAANTNLWNCLHNSVVVDQKTTVVHDSTRARSERCNAGPRLMGKVYAKDDLDIDRYRMRALSVAHGDVFVGLEGRTDRLSVSLEDNHSRWQNEKVLNEQRNEPGASLGVESSCERTQCGRRRRRRNSCVAGTNMEGSFNAQDLNAIRRFLGMSLQQINENKMVDKNIEGCDVVPDYPSTYLKNSEEKGLMNHDDSCELQCEFKQFGCEFAGTRCALHLHNHMTSHMTEHLNLVSKTAHDQKRQLQQQRTMQENQGHVIRELRETVFNMKQMVEDQTKKNEKQEKTVVSLKDQLKEQRKQNQRFERDISHQFQTLSSQSASTTSPVLPNMPVAEAEMLWPIKHFTKILRRVQERGVDDPLVSEAFYTGQYGYKLALWVYPNGRGKTLGTCVSVYARIMPGEHDQVLGWPVRPTYTFTVFDQSEASETENVVRTRQINTIKRDGGNKVPGIQRPEGGDRATLVGFEDFITHDKLATRNYLKDDCFYLKVDVTLFCS